MKRMTIPLFLVAGIAAFVVGIGPSFLARSNVDAQAPKGRQQWEYAHLVLGDTAADLNWQNGKTTVSAGDVNKPDPTRSIEALYRQLGGKEPDPTLGVLLNLIGQEGWEMVSYSRPSGVQAWVFKRPRQ